MKYHVEFTSHALKQLKKPDKPSASLILGWFRKNLENCENPRIHGKGLTANLSGQWRYRVGDYRIIAEIQDKRVIIPFIKIGSIIKIGGVVKATPLCHTKKD